MSIEQDFIPFGETAASLESLASYATNAPGGNIAGVASSAFANRAFRQANAIAAAVANYLGMVNGTDVLDNGIAAQINACVTAAFAILPPLPFQFSTGSGTFDLPQWVFTGSANATTAAVYTDGNSNSYTVVNTVAAGTQILFNGTTPMKIGTGALTLTKSSGTGDATITYYAVRSPLNYEVEMAGGGGGGGAGAAGTSGQRSAGAPGGGGAYVRTRFLLPTTSFTYLIGAGGTGGVAGGAAAVDGANSTFGGGSLLQAGGGNHGAGGAATSTFPATGGVAGNGGLPAGTAISNPGVYINGAEGTQAILLSATAVYLGVGGQCALSVYNVETGGGSIVGWGSGGVPGIGSGVTGANGSAGKGGFLFLTVNWQ